MKGTLARRCTRAATGKAPRMTTQIPYGPASADYPQFAAGHAQYPPAGYQVPVQPGVPAQAGAEHHVPGHGQQDQQVYGQHHGAGHQAPAAYDHQAGYQAGPAAGYQAGPAAGYQAEAGYHTSAQTGYQAGHQAGYQAGQQAGHQAGQQAPDGYGQYPGGGGGYGDHEVVGYPGHDASGQVAVSPPSAYPTAPPWVTQSPAPDPPPADEGPAAAVAPYGSVPQVGGLLVPYPEEMRNAARAQAPKVWPVAVFTLFFNVLGVFSAVRRAGQARRGRNSTAPYWLTFVVSALVSSFLMMTAVVSVGIPVYVQLREGATVKALEDNVLHDGQLAKANISPTKAECRAAGEWAGEKRDYLCELTLSGGGPGGCS
ncbi:hypothetical protein Asp14428_27980 [Actinoplanes sp. NBRC 14428]|nr:hypothetical protein Asp14428_27980 [Actinoplanes sp. NBRC 14428]